MVVYLDGVMGMNFLVDWLLLLGVNRLAGFPPGTKRTAAAAAVGSGYAGMCLMPGLGFLAGSIGRFVSLVVITVSAFGWSRSALQRGILFVMLSMTLGGIAMCAGSGQPLGALTGAGILAILCKLGLRGNALRRLLLPVQIRYAEKAVSCLALCDTGNTLKDPLTGESVLVVNAGVGQRLLNLTAQQLGSPVDTVSSHPELGLRLLPYGTVGNSGGFLIALRCERVQVGTRNAAALVAFSPEQFGNGDYQALTGGYDG